MAPERTSKPSGTPRTRTEKVHHALRNAIIEQQLAPGSRLPEDAIGDSFGTSRTIALSCQLRSAKCEMADSAKRIAAIATIEGPAGVSSISDSCRPPSVDPAPKSTASSAMPSGVRDRPRAAAAS